MDDSCIVSDFRSYVDLTEEEEELLAWLEKDTKEYGSGSTVSEAGTSEGCLYTIRSGWAAACRFLPDGERQILDIYLPGQIMCLREIGFKKTTTSFIALDNLVACPYPKTNLVKVFEHSPRLADVFLLIMARQELMLIERIINIGRRSAARRLAHFILEMRIRVNPEGNDFEIPLTQEVIGDALGLSAVHVSRTLRKLRDRDFVRIDSGVVKINRLDDLIEFSDFDASYLEPDTSWIRAYQ